MDEIEKLLADMRKRLVDTGTRNRVIHVNRKNKRAKSIPIIGERSEDIFRILRTNKKKMKFAPRGQEEEVDASEIRLAPSDIKIDESRFTDDFLDTPFTPDALQKKLLRIARDAQTAEEEQGINILYMAMGFLKWFEDENSDIAREAPLILIPVDLKRNKRTSSHDIISRDEDIVTNLPLQERLLNDFGIELPEIDDNTDWFPSEYFCKVSETIQSQSRWEIDKNGMQVGFFSSAKVLMQKDLDPQNWSDGSLIGNPIIKGLLAQGFEAEAPLFPENKNLDEVLNFEDLLHVIDADASQTKVIEEVRSGRNLVVQGPPGTGKSQTIINILSAAVHDGKKVLFIAEKMAALNVVHRKMSKLGLKDLCVELHSRNANKKSFLNELARTLFNKKDTSSDLSNTNLHIETRDQLNDISKALHTNVKGMDFSPFEVLSKLIKFSGEKVPPPRFWAPVLEDMTVSKEKEILKTIDEFRSLHKGQKDFSKHPFRDVQNLELQPPDLDRVVEEINKILISIVSLRKNVQEIVRKLGLDSPDTFEKIDELEKFVAAIRSAPVADEKTWETCLRELKKSNSDFILEIQRAIDWVETSKKLKDAVFESVYDADLPKLRCDIEKGIHGWFYRIFGPYRKSSKELKLISKTEIPKSAEDRLGFIDKMMNAKEKKKTFENSRNYLSKKIGENWREENTDFKTLQSCWDWLVSAGSLAINFSASNLKEIIDELQDMSEHLEDQVATSELENKIEAISNRLNIEQFSETGVRKISFEELNVRLRAISENINLYHEWVSYSDKRTSLESHGLEKLVEVINLGLSIDRVKPEFLYALNETRWKIIRKSRPELDRFSKLDRHEIVRRFKDYEKCRIRETKELIRDRHLSQLPTGAAGEMRFLRDQIAIKKRHKPIRKIMTHAASMVQRIKPVFLMSPVSVAQFLPPEKLDFDLLVIDEASQVKPEDALGSVARAKQIVVVGDRKQLPPTRFFENLTDNESGQDDYDEDNPRLSNASEMESILTLCDARGISNSMCHIPGGSMVVF